MQKSKAYGAKYQQYILHEMQPATCTMTKVEHTGGSSTLTTVLLTSSPSDKCTRGFSQLTACSLTRGQGHWVERQLMRGKKGKEREREWRHRSFSFILENTDYKVYSEARD